MQLRLFMIGKVAAPKGGSNTTLAFNWAGDRSVEYASHPRVQRRITWDLRREPTGTAAAQQQDRLDPQVPAYPIPLNDCSLVLPPLSEYGEEANERRRAGSVRGAAIRTTALGKSAVTINNHVC